MQDASPGLFIYVGWKAHPDEWVALFNQMVPHKSVSWRFQILVCSLKHPGVQGVPRGQTLAHDW